MSDEIKSGTGAAVFTTPPAGVELHLEIVWSKDLEPAIALHGRQVLDGAKFLHPSLASGVVMWAARMVHYFKSRSLVLPKSRVRIWTDVDRPRREWLQIDDHPPVSISEREATDLLTIAERAVRLAGHPASEVGVPTDGVSP